MGFSFWIPSYTKIYHTRAHTHSNFMKQHLLAGRDKYNQIFGHLASRDTETCFELKRWQPEPMVTVVNETENTPVLMVV